METNIAPNVSDIRDQDMSLRIVRGFETANRVDLEMASTFTASRGEWVSKAADGKVSQVGSSPAAGSRLVFRGTEGFDHYATKKLTVLEHSTSVIFQTSNFVAGSYSIDDKLVAVLDSGKGKLRKAANAGEEALAVGKVNAVADGVLEVCLF